MKAIVKELGVEVAIEPVAVHIDVAATMLGISRRAFYDYFVTPKRIVPVYVGSRAMVDVEKLRAAWREYQQQPEARESKGCPDDLEAA